MSKLSKILLTETFHSQWSGPFSLSKKNNLPPPPLQPQKFSSRAYKTCEARFYTPKTPPDTRVQSASTRAYTTLPASNPSGEPDRSDFQKASWVPVIPGAFSPDDFSPASPYPHSPVSTSSLQPSILAANVYPHDHRPNSSPVNQPKFWPPYDGVTASTVKDDCSTCGGRWNEIQKVIKLAHLYLN